MATIATSKYRIENAKNFKNSLNDLSLYMFIGKTDSWSSSLTVPSDTTVPPPANTESSFRTAFNNMIALKRITASDISLVVPRYDWLSGTTYIQWDDQDPYIYGGGINAADLTHKKFYVITDSLYVYKCLKVGSGASTQKPTGQSTAPINLSDGYTWVYMYTISAADSNKFVTPGYIPVKTVVLGDGQTIDDLTTEDAVQYQHQIDAKNANKGSIFNIVPVSGGSGYTSTPTVNVLTDGTGTGASAVAIVQAGAVVGYTVSSPGINYTNAVIQITGGGGSGARARAVIAPFNGHGSDPEFELGAFYITTSTTFLGNEGSGDFPTGMAFRQVGLITNPVNYGTTTVSTATTLNGSKGLNLSSGSAFVPGDYITGATSGAIAYVDFYDSTNQILRIHRNDKTNYKNFTGGETIEGHTVGSGTVASSSFNRNPEYQPFQGNIIQISHVAPINTTTTQTERVVCVTKF